MKLGRVYPIAEVRVYGRTDAQTERLAGAKVYFHTVGVAVDLGNITQWATF